MAMCSCGEMDSICEHSPCFTQASRWWDEMKVAGVEFEDFENKFWSMHRDKFDKHSGPADKSYWIPFKRFCLMVRDSGLSFKYHNIKNQLYLIKDLVEEMSLEARDQRDIETRERLRKKRDADADVVKSAEETLIQKQKELAAIQDENTYLKSLEKQNQDLMIRIAELEEENESIKASGVGTSPVIISDNGTGGELNYTSTVRMEQILAKSGDSRSNGSDKQNSRNGVEVNIHNHFKTATPKENRFR